MSRPPILVNQRRGSRKSAPASGEHAPRAQRLLDTLVLECHKRREGRAKCHSRMCTLSWLHYYRNGTIFRLESINLQLALTGSGWKLSTVLHRPTWHAVIEAHSHAQRQV